MKKIYFFFLLINNVLSWNPTNYPFIPASTDTSKIRELIIEAQGKNKRILDIGCGKGYSTSSSKGSLGIDKNKHNIKEAKKLFPNKKFKQTLSYNDDKEYDIVTCMFYLSDIPRHIRRETINRALEIAKERVVIVDINPDYKPEKGLLNRHLYIPDYMKNCRYDLILFNESILIKNLLSIWTYNKKKSYNKIIAEQNIINNILT